MATLVKKVQPERSIPSYGMTRPLAIPKLPPTCHRYCETNLQRPVFNWELPPLKKTSGTAEKSGGSFATNVGENTLLNSTRIMPHIRINLSTSITPSYQRYLNRPLICAKNWPKAHPPAKTYWMNWNCWKLSGKKSNFSI